MKTLADLKPGESGIIHSFADGYSALKMMEMGCLPGSNLKLVRTALMGSPFFLKVGRQFLALRREDAAKILLEDNKV